MKESVREGLWWGGVFLGSTITRALARLNNDRATIVSSCVTAVWFVGWLVCDKILFKKEIAAQTQRLAERRAAVRAAKYAAALERARNQPPSQ